jgi:hypothetical protein
MKTCTMQSAPQKTAPTSPKADADADKLAAWAALGTMLAAIGVARRAVQTFEADPAVAALLADPTFVKRWESFKGSFIDGADTTLMNVSGHIESRLSN